MLANASTTIVDDIFTLPKQQQFHATIELALRHPHIAAEYKILRKLRDTVDRAVVIPALRRPLDVHPALYGRYRNTGFPIRTDGNRKYPQWRSLSPWMRLQLENMCIAEHRHVHVRLRLHDAIVERHKNLGRDYRSYLRDRMTRVLQERFGEGLHFLFVLEDLDRDGVTPVRPHAHGVVMLPHVDLDDAVDGRTIAARARQVARHGKEVVEFTEGRKRLREALKFVVGNGGQLPSHHHGVCQSANVWTRTSYNPRFNFEAISYAFKNVDAEASDLPANRIARSRGLVTEARRFWDLVRLGEPAIAAWLSR